MKKKKLMGCAVLYNNQIFSTAVVSEACTGGKASLLKSQWLGGNWFFSPPVFHLLSLKFVSVKLKIKVVSHLFCLLIMFFYYWYLFVLNFFKNIVFELHYFLFDCFSFYIKYGIYFLYYCIFILFLVCIFFSILFLDILFQFFFSCFILVL